MAIKLIVTEPFASYAKGDEITDSKIIQQILDGENAGHVVKAQAPGAPSAAPAAAA